MKKKLLVLLMVTLLALSLCSCGKTDTPKEEAVKQEVDDKKEEKEEKEEKETFSEYIGKPLPELMSKVDELGYTATYFADGVDFTEFIDDMKDLYLTGEIKEDYENKTIEVTLKSISNIEAEEAQVELNEKLPEGDAWIAAKHYGQEQFGEGFDLHFLTGKINASAEDANTWFLKAECSIDNLKMVCEAKVTGTKDAPEVISFDVY